MQAQASNQNSQRLDCVLELSLVALDSQRIQLERLSRDALKQISTHDVSVWCKQTGTTCSQLLKSRTCSTLPPKA